MIVSTIQQLVSRRTIPRTSTQQGFPLASFQQSSKIRMSKGQRFGLLFSSVLIGVWMSHILPAQALEVVPAAIPNPQILLKDALAWIQAQGAVGAVAFIGIYIVAAVAFLPGSILTLGAGAVFGVIQGSILVFIGATIGATAAFLVGRYIARDWVAKKISGNKKFASVDKAVGREGLKIVLLTRLSPIFPFNILNYAMGLTSVSLKDYVIASIGMLPGTIMYVYIGSLAGSLAQIGTESQPENAAIQWTIRIVGFIATVAVTLYVTRVARKALEEEIV